MFLSGILSWLTLPKLSASPYRNTGQVFPFNVRQD